MNMKPFLIMVATTICMVLWMCTKISAQYAIEEPHFAELPPVLRVFRPGTDEEFRAAQKIAGGQPSLMAAMEYAERK